MSVFEYVMVLVAIIVGLAVARMLEGILRILRAGRPYPAYWVHSVWVGIVFFELVGHWAYRWADFNGRTSWTHFELLFFLLPTILLFLAAGLLFPEEKVADAKAYYFDQRRPFLAVFIALLVVYSLETWWVLDMGVGNRGDFVRSTMVALCAPLLVSRRPILHGVLTVLILLLIVAIRFPILGGAWGRFAG